MGEIAEMMLAGCICEGCGEYLVEGDGYPTRCAACQGDLKPEKAPKSIKVECPVCKKKVKSAGLNDHIRDVHTTKV